MADKYKYTFNLPFDQEEIAPEPTGVMGKTAAPKPQEKSWDQQLADMLGAYWGSPEEAKKRTSPTPPADYTDEELSIYEKYADVSPPYAEGMIGGLRDMQAYRERWGITTSLTDKPKWLTEQGSDVRVPEEPTIQTQELPDIDPETGQPILSGADVVAKEVARKMPQETADTGSGLMSSPRPKQRPEGSEPRVTNSDGFMDTFIDVIGKAEGTKDHTAQEGQFTYAYGVLPATAKQYGISIDDYPDRRSFAKAVFSEMYKEANTKHPKVFDGMTDAQKSATMLLYINTGKLYNGVEKALEEKDFVKAGKNLTNIVHYTERDENSPDYGKKFSSKGLSARRAKEYNVFASAMDGMPLVDKVSVTGSMNKPTFNWVDTDGNIIYSFTSSKPMQPSKSSMKSVAVPKNVTGN